LSRGYRERQLHLTFLIINSETTMDSHKNNENFLRESAQIHESQQTITPEEIENLHLSRDNQVPIPQSVRTNPPSRGRARRNQAPRQNKQGPPQIPVEERPQKIVNRRPDLNSVSRDVETLIKDVDRLYFLLGKIGDKIPEVKAALASAPVYKASCEQPVSFSFKPEEWNNQIRSKKPHESHPKAYFLHMNPLTGVSREPRNFLEEGAVIASYPIQQASDEWLVQKSLQPMTLEELERGAVMDIWRAALLGTEEFLKSLELLQWTAMDLKADQYVEFDEDINLGPSDQMMSESANYFRTGHRWTFPLLFNRFVVVLPKPISTVENPPNISPVERGAPGITVRSEVPLSFGGKLVQYYSYVFGGTRINVGTINGDVKQLLAVAGTLFKRDVQNLPTDLSLYITTFSERPFDGYSFSLALLATIKGICIRPFMSGAIISGNAYLPNEIDVKLAYVKAKYQGHLLVSSDYNEEHLPEVYERNIVACGEGDYFFEGKFLNPTFCTLFSDMIAIASMSIPKVSNLAMNPNIKYAGAKPNAPFQAVKGPVEEKEDWDYLMSMNDQLKNQYAELMGQRFFDVWPLNKTVKQHMAVLMASYAEKLEHKRRGLATGGIKKYQKALENLQNQYAAFEAPRIAKPAKPKGVAQIPSEFLTPEEQKLPKEERLRLIKLRKRAAKTQNAPAVNQPAIKRTGPPPNKYAKYIPKQAFNPADFDL
jgi:hypothetical protein